MIRGHQSSTELYKMTSREEKVSCIQGPCLGASPQKDASREWISARGRDWSRAQAASCHLGRVSGSDEARAVSFLTWYVVGVKCVQ